MSISISNLVARKRLKNPNEEVYTNVSLATLADWHSKNSWPTGPGQELSPLNVGEDVSMELFGPDDAHKVSSCIHYMMIKPETQESYTSGYDTITSTLGDAEVKFRVRGFRNDGDGYASVRFYHPTGQAAQAANPYDQTITGVGTTTATAAHFQNLGGNNTGTIGFHMDVKITYYNEIGEVGVTTWNRNQIGESGGAASFGGESWYEIYPENKPAGTFNAGHCLVFIQGPQCSSHRWSGSITPVKDTFSDWMICHGEQMILSDGNGAGRPDGYQDAVGSPNRHGTTAGTASEAERRVSPSANLNATITTTDELQTVTGPWRTWTGNFTGNVSQLLADDGYEAGVPIDFEYINYIGSGAGGRMRASSNTYTASGLTGSGAITQSMNGYNFGVRGSVTTFNAPYDLTSDDQSTISIGVGQKLTTGRNGQPGVDGGVRVRVNGQVTVETYTLTLITTTGISTWKWSQGTGALSDAISVSTTSVQVPVATGITVYGYNSSGTLVSEKTI